MMKASSLGVLSMAALLSLSGESPCTSLTDADQDGWPACTDDLAMFTETCDCDDTNPSIHPGAAEDTTTGDDDCDGVSEWGIELKPLGMTLDEVLTDPIQASPGEVLVELKSNDMCAFSLDGELKGCYNIYLSNGKQCYAFHQIVNHEGLIAVIGRYYPTDWLSEGASCFATISPGTYQLLRENTDLPTGLDLLTDLIQTTDGSYFVTGARYLSETIRVGSLMKLDQEGKLLWVKDYGEPSDSRYSYYLRSIAEATDGDLLVMGIDCNVLPGTCEMIYRTDTDGNLRWLASVSTTQGMYMVDEIQAGVHNDAIVIGHDPEFQVDAVRSIGSDGEVVWTWYGPKDGISVYAVVHSDGRITTVSYLEDQSGYDEISTNQLTADGDEIWSGRVFAPRWMDPTGITVLPDESFVITGTTDYYAPDNGFAYESGVLIRLDQRANPIPYPFEVIEYTP